MPDDQSTPQHPTGWDQLAPDVQAAFVELGLEFDADEIRVAASFTDPKWQRWRLGVVRNRLSGPSPSPSPAAARPARGKQPAKPAAPQPTRWPTPAPTPAPIWHQVQTQPAPQAQPAPIWNPSPTPAAVSDVAKHIEALSEQAEKPRPSQTRKEYIEECQQRAEAAVAEILPNFDSVMDQAKALAEDALPGAVSDLLETIAGAGFTRIEERRLLSAIDAATGLGMQTLKAELKEARAVKPKSGALTPGNDWRSLLIIDPEKREAKPIMSNALVVALRHPGLAGAFALNDFTDLIELLFAPPWLRDADRKAFRPRDFTEADKRAATAWMQHEAGILAPSHIIMEGIQAAAECNRFHPVRDYLNVLKWDDKPRIDYFFLTYFSAQIGDDPDSEDGAALLAYYKAIGARSLIAAVARIFEPGCKVDTTPNLFGPQGIGKSSGVAELFSDKWFTDDLADLGSKDSQLQIAGKWAAELGEMAAASRHLDRNKAFITRREDRYRKPYDRTLTTQPRQIVFWGTTNRDAFLFDETGNRRSWGVCCGSSIDTAGIKRDRDQLWAEAVHRYRSGEKWHLHERELIATAAKVQSGFVEEDAWHRLIVDYVAGRAETSVSEILADKIGLADKDREQRHANRVAKVLVLLGWKRVQKRIGVKPVWIYRAPEGWLDR